MTYSRDDFAAEADVSRETLKAFDVWHGLLQTWNRKINLVAPGTVADFWRRHALDSWQIAAHVPSRAEKCLDMGSGAGFPGLAVAIALEQSGSGRVLLVESAGKKASFLKTVTRTLSLPADITSTRAETLSPQSYDLITARAFAPLPKLLNYAQSFWGEGTIGLFPKGQSAEAELTEASKYWTYDVEILPSRSDPAGVILKISGLAARS